MPPSEVWVRRVFPFLFFLWDAFIFSHTNALKMRRMVERVTTVAVAFGSVIYVSLLSITKTFYMKDSASYMLRNGPHLWAHYTALLTSTVLSHCRILCKLRLLILKFSKLHPNPYISCRFHKHKILMASFWSGLWNWSRKEENPFRFWCFCCSILASVSHFPFLTWMDSGYCCKLQVLIIPSKWGKRWYDRIFNTFCTV